MPRPSHSLQPVLRQKIASRTLTLGSWITLGHPSIAEIMAKAGFDWIVVDLEHSMIGLEQAGELIRTIDLCGVSPLVRLTSNDPNQIKRVMDAGAHGIVVPMVNSAEEATRAVAATRYAPQGTRGVGLSRAQGWGVRFREYLEWQKEGPVVMVQIEHRDGVAHLEDILAVPGVDGFIIGPYDLSCSMGIPGQFDRPEFVSALQGVLATSKRLQRPAGVHLVEPDLDRLDQAIRDGYTFIAYSVDFRFLDHGLRQGVERLKGRTS
jgi:2-keto-3-deoxy-L-rhamnonate aldolase RhmA